MDKESDKVSIEIRDMVRALQAFLARQLGAPKVRSQPDGGPTCRAGGRHGEIPCRAGYPRMRLWDTMPWQ
jgi:hypothetical protein